MFRFFSITHAPSNLWLICGNAGFCVLICDQGTRHQSIADTDLTKHEGTLDQEHDQEEQEERGGKLHTVWKEIIFSAEQEGKSI